MGRRAAANLEIDAFRRPGSPAVLDIEAVRDFLERIEEHPSPLMTVKVKSVRWHLPDDAPADWLEQVNRDGSELVDEELRVSGELEVWMLSDSPLCGTTYTYSFESHHTISEYLGNKKTHSIVISYELPRKEDSLRKFLDGAGVLQDLMLWIGGRCGISFRKTEQYITAITT